MRLIIAVLGLFFISSCAQLTRLDTARTIGKGNIELGGQISAYGVNQIASPDLGGGALPFVTLNANTGITEKLDAMISVNTGGNVFLSPKYQIVGDQESQLAVALVPGIDMQLGLTDNVDDGAIIFRPHFSTIISMHQDEWALFFEPKYIYQDITKTHFVGTTIGVDYSLERTSFALGISYFPVLGENSNPGERIYNIGFGIRRLVN